MAKGPISQSRVPSFGYVPNILPNELLYSFLGNLITLNALSPPREYLQKLFSDRNIIPGIDLPTKLEALQQNLGQFSPFASVSALIDDATMYPYHRPFLPESRHTAIQQILLNGDGRRLKVLMGRVANGFGAKPPLRYCPCCAEEDISLHGRAYWKRTHQLPGVTCCTVHQVKLIMHLSLSYDEHKQSFISFPQLLTEPRTSIKPSSNELYFARLSADLLKANLPNVDIAVHQNVYTERILKLGLGRTGANINFHKLARAVDDYYGSFNGFVHRERLLSSNREPLRWIKAIFRRPQSASHPICHLLLIGFLFKSFDEFCHALQSSKPNQASLKKVIQHKNFLANLFSQHDKDLIQDASLSCRQVARKLNLSVQTVVTKRRQSNIAITERFKHIDPVLREKIARSIEDGQSISQVASQFHFSLSSVYRIRASSKLLKNAHREACQSILHAKHRDIWNQILSQQPNAGKKAARAVVPATYAWLYRNDREWLLRTGQKKPNSAQGIDRVQWQKRDLQISHSIQMYVDTLKEKQERPRISTSLILKGFNEAMIRKNIHKLPAVSMKLQELSESINSFQKFRISRAIHQLLSQGLSVKLWKIQRMAGIKQWTKPLLQHVRLSLEKQMK